GDGDFLGKLPYPESEVDHRLAAHCDVDSASDLGLEARVLSLDFIIAQGQIGSGVTPPRVGNHGSSDSRIEVPDCDLGPRDGGSRLILYGPGNCSRGHLG